MPYAIYILKCSDGSYYTGSTKELDAKKEALIRGDIEGIHEIVKRERKRREKDKSESPR